VAECRNAQQMRRRIQHSFNGFGLCVLSSCVLLFFVFFCHSLTHTHTHTHTHTATEYASNMAAVTTRYFLFPVGNFISAFGFSAVRWWIVGILLMETWDFVISLATCQPGNSSEYLHVERVLVEGPDPSGPRHADSPPVLRHWQLVV